MVASRPEMAISAAHAAVSTSAGEEVFQRALRRAVERCDHVGGDLGAVVERDQARGELSPPDDRTLVPGGLDPLLDAEELVATRGAPFDIGWADGDAVGAELHLDQRRLLGGVGAQELDPHTAAAAEIALEIADVDRHHAALGRARRGGEGRTAVG